MKSHSFKTLTLFAVALAFLACGTKLSESERSYVDACLKYAKGGEAYRKLCECSAPIVVPKLTKAELNAYTNSVDLIGKPMTNESVASRGFTLADFTSMGTKRQAAFEEMTKTCGGAI